MRIEFAYGSFVARNSAENKRWIAISTNAVMPWASTPPRVSNKIAQTICGYFMAPPIFPSLAPYDYVVIFPRLNNQTSSRDRMRGKTIVVTGATSGIGEVAAVPRRSGTDNLSRDVHIGVSDA